MMTADRNLNGPGAQTQSAEPWRSRRLTDGFINETEQNIFDVNRNVITDFCRLNGPLTTRCEDEPEPTVRAASSDSFKDRMSEHVAACVCGDSSR